MSDRLLSSSVGVAELNRYAAQQQKRVTAVLTHRVQHEPDHSGRRTGEDPAGVPTDQPRRYGQAQLVHQVGGGELRIEAGTALGEHAAVANLTEAL